MRYGINNRWIVFIIIVLSGSTVLYGGESAVQDSVERFVWPGGAKGAVTLSYDDAIDSHFRQVAPYLNKMGIHATFYIKVGRRSFQKHVDQWRAVAQMGHELGNHSLFHPCMKASPEDRPWLPEVYNLANYTAERWEDEMEVANFVLQLIDGRTERTFGNTCCGNWIGKGENRMNLEPIIAKLFPAARGECISRSIDPEHVNFNNLGHYSGDGKTFEQLKAEIESAVNQGHWIFYMFHGVGKGTHTHYIDQAEHERLIEYLAANQSRIWTAPAMDVVRYLREPKKRENTPRVERRTMDQPTDSNAVVLDILPDKGKVRNSEGAFMTLKGGRVMFVYSEFSGGREDDSAAKLVRIDSTDGGHTWSVPSVVVENKAGCNVMSVSLLRLASGKIALIYMHKNSLHDCKPVMRISEDEGTSWSQEREAFPAPGYFVLNNDRVIQTSSGRLIMPLAYHRPIYRKGEPFIDLRGLVLWYRSDDEGVSWKESPTWWGLPIASDTGLQEPGVVELADGSLYCWARTDVGCQYEFHSTDGGKTWSQPKPSAMISPKSPASIKRIPGTDKLLCVYNDHSGQFAFTPKKRTPLVVAVSEDNGKTWPVRKLIEDEPGGHYCYTAIHFLEEKPVVLLAYCRGYYEGEPEPLCSIRIRMLDLKWIER